jgi:patatin-like phospholipase/acyl hydrolase
MVRKRKILALDGGGIKGIFAAAFLETIESATGKRIQDHFDLVAGTSTGGIVAVGLGLGMSAKEIVEFYVNEGPRIFDQTSPFDRPRLPSRVLDLLKSFIRKVKQLGFPKYDSQGLRNALERAFKSARLDDSQIRLLIPAYHADKEDVYVFKTRHHERLRVDYRESAVNVALATAAAPTFFKSHQMPSGSPMIDGGIWANNPSGLAAVEARGMLGWTSDDLYILSLGCTEEVIDIPTNTGFAGVIKLIELLMQGQSRALSGTAMLLSGHTEVAPHYFRYQPKVATEKFSLDRVNMINRLRGLGQADARNALPTIEKIFLNEKAAPFNPCPAALAM